MEIGVLYLSHAMLVLAELIVCSTRGFACILAKWFWPTEVSLSFTYGSPEASCNKRADTYLGRRSASLMKEFWTLCIFFRLPHIWLPTLKLKEGSEVNTSSNQNEETNNQSQASSFSTQVRRWCIKSAGQQLKLNSKTGIRLFWLPFIDQMEILV